MQDDPVLGISAGQLWLDRRELIRNLGAQMANQAHRELLLFSHALDPDLYDQRPFLDALQTLALARPDLPVRILLYDSQTPCQNGHRLIELARRLTSRIAIRRVENDDQKRQDAFLIADRCGYIYRQIAGTMEAIADFNSPGEAGRLRTTFIQLWDRGTTDLQMRQLFI